MANQTMLDTPNTPSPYLHTPSPAAIILPLLALVVIIIDTPCLIWHMSNRNLPASLLVGWVILKNAFAFTNALLWPTDDFASWWDGKIYCDAVVKLDFAASSAIIASTFCIMRALALALDTNRPVMMSESENRIRHNIVVCLLCVGLPIYEMVAAFVVQPGRYYLLAISGCAMAQWKSLTLILLCYVPLMALVLGTVFYAVLVVIRLKRYKQDLASVLASTESGLSKSRFMRLLGLCSVLVFIYTPLFIYMICSEVGDTLYPFSWSVVHNPSTFKNIIFVRTYGVAQLESWTRISIGFIVFACFGFGKDIKKTYRGCLERLGLTRFFPNLWLDEHDPRNTKRRKNLNKHQSAGLSSDNSDSRLKSRTRKWVMKLASSSSSSSSTTAATSTRSGSTRNASPLKPVFTPTTPTNRPSGLLEQDLFESGDITFDREETTSSNPVIAAPSQATLRESRRPAELPAPAGRLQSHQHAVLPQGSWFSRFCERYAHGMSQRPQQFFSPSLHRQHSSSALIPTGSVLSATRNVSAGAAVKGTDAYDTRERKAMKYKAYEEYVLGRLA